MKRKAVIAMIGAMSMTLTAAPFMQASPAFAAETEAEAVVVQADPEAESALPDEVKPEESKPGALVQEEADAGNSMQTEAEALGNAMSEKKKITLKEIEYQAGNIDKKGWKNDFFKIGYRPESGVVMDPEADMILEEYYERNGADSKVATSEMIASSGLNSYLQIMAEINPINEKKADILEDFMKTENFKADTVTGAAKVGDIEFSTVDGKTGDGSSCLLAVSDSKDGVVLAVKLKYADEDAKSRLLAGFISIEDSQAEEASEDTGVSEPAAQEEQAAEPVADAENKAEAKGKSLLFDNAPKKAKR